MSTKSAEAFIQKMAQDEKFIKNVVACRDADERKIFAKKAGFDFTTDEINTVWNKTSQQQLKLAPNFNIDGITPKLQIQWTCCWYESLGKKK